MLRKEIIGAMLMAALSASLGAQTLSPAEIRAMVDERAEGLNEYQALLNDPDPVRSIAAMKIMMQSGDWQLERMALEYGIYSTSTAVRRAALEAFFNASPTLEIWIDGSALDEKHDQSYFRGDVSGFLGSISSGPRGFLSLKVGDFDQENACWIIHSSNNKKGCLVRLSENSVTLELFGRWHNLVLNDEGELVGQLMTRSSAPPTPVSIKVAR